MAEAHVEESHAAGPSQSQQQGNSSLSSERKKKSAIWAFYSVSLNDASKAVCHTCNELVSRGGKSPRSFNTTNLRKHLEAHPDKYKEFSTMEDESCKEKEKSNGNRQVTLETLLDKQKPYSIDNPRSKLLSHRIAEMMAVDLQPFSIVDDPGFCRLMKAAEPRYVIPSRKYFSEVLIPEIHSKVTHLVSQLLKCTSYVSVTTDIWSSDNSHHSFMSLVAHFILTNSFEKKSVMLSCWKFDESHTAENISASILSHIQSWDVEEKLVCVVRDNASNMVAGMRVAELPSLPCLAHTLQLIIMDGIFQQPSVQQLLTSARSIVGFYNRSNTAFHTLKQIQNQLGLPQHILFQDVSTRWNSSFYMLQRLLEQKRAITVAGTECTSVPTEIRAQQWTLAEKVVQLLVVFEEATREASGDYASCAIIIPITNTLKLALLTDEEDQGIMAMKRAMMKSLEDRYGKVEENPLCAIATVLDPRFKLRVFSSGGRAANARMLVTTECEKVISSIYDSEKELPAKRSRTESDKPPSSLWSFFDDMIEKPSNPTNGVEENVSGYTAEVMVEMYLKEPIQDRHIDPLIYWKTKQVLWKGLAVMASKYLSIPPSSASSERLFSSAGDIISKERNRLGTEKAEMLLFLKHNLPVFDYKY